MPTTRASKLFLLPFCLSFAVNPGARDLPAQEPHFIIRGPSVDSTTRMRLTSMLDAERPRVLSELGMPSATVVTMDLYPTYGALAQAASARGVVLTPGIPGFAFGPDQVHMISPTALGWTRLEDAVSYLIHEYTHCLMVQRNPQVVQGPRWLWEALATYEARYRKDPQRWSWLVPSRAPSLASMNDPLDGRAIEIGYTIGEYIVQRWGMATFARLIDGNGRVEEVLGLSQARFEEEWFAWLRKVYAV